VTAVRRLPELRSAWELAADVVVVGAGAAGAAAALAASAAGSDVILLCKGTLGSGATAWAQGGLAAVLDPDDSLELHALDTVAAGAGLCDEAAVRTLVAASRDELSRLIGLGAVFDRGEHIEPGLELAVTREGGHSRSRIVHAGGDASGAEVDRVLTSALRRSGVRVLEHVVALDAVLDERGVAVGLTVARLGLGGLEPGQVRADAVVLATGGLGQAWATTSNPGGATGSGLALAARAGAALIDTEFVQFHPTVLYQGTAARGQQLLITEAVRGEGAVLVGADGRPLMAGRHPRGDLAPRDVVAVAIYQTLAADGGTHVYLDATGLGSEVLERRFPTVVAGCRAIGIDPVSAPIPVAPGAHYACGGIAADLSGRTSVPGLLAVGEVAATGMHGANRLASNSIPEALATGRRAGELVAAERARKAGPALNGAVGRPVDPAARSRTAELTSQYAGVVRDAQGLRRLLDHLDAVPGVPRHDGSLSLAEVEATDLHTVSTLVATAALHRQESRGCHRRSDYPAQRDEWARRVTWRLEDDEFRPISMRRRVAA
jgi:L-aspartate oxidase